MGKKIYAEDKAKIALNRATATDRRIWNDRVDAAKARQNTESQYFFMPRKVSHKQGYKLDRF